MLKVIDIDLSLRLAAFIFDLLLDHLLDCVYHGSHYIARKSLRYVALWRCLL
jgi:hypothetical protein